MTLKQYQKEYYSLINQMKQYNQNDNEYIQLGMKLIYLIKDHPILDKLIEIKG